MNTTTTNLRLRENRVLVNTIINRQTPNAIDNIVILIPSNIREEKKSEEEVLWTAADYSRNKYGDEYAYIDNLGFEGSCMGNLADYNHIF